MPKPVDLSGKHFGRLTVIKRSKKLYYWLCKCDCGKTVDVRHSNLQNGNTKSCGCLIKDTASKNFKTHGMSHDRLFRIWCSMRQRCENRNRKYFHRYGGRGITVCPEWQEFIPFYKWAIANGYKEGLTIDRIDNDSGYSPNNCRWVDMIQQNNNTSANRKITLSGETHTIAEGERLKGYLANTIHTRLRRGWTNEEAILGRSRRHK